MNINNNIKFQNISKSNKKSALLHPKGRQLDVNALKQIQILLGNFPREKQLLIEYLHLIQDKYGHLSINHMHALAHEMKLSQAEVYQVASFYAHFDIVMDGETPPPPLTIRVCSSISCNLKNADNLLKELQQKPDENIRVISAPCMGRCHNAPIVEIGHNHILNADMDKIITAIKTKDIHPTIPKIISFDDYKNNSGYKLLKDCLNNKYNPDDIIEIIEKSGLRGLGGAGFPTGRKWRLVRSEKSPRLMAVNGDEGEPGTIKDHHYLTTDPHRFLEGMLIGAWVVDASDIYIYMRDEYPDVIAMLRCEIKKLENDGLAINSKIHLRRGAGAYICGEESAMIESIEGKRGLPRHRPPFVAQVGLFNKPTLVNNIESLYWVREIFEKGADWFKSYGRNGRNGLRSYSVSGHVKAPGVKLAPAGITIDQLINEFCGGMTDGHKFKAYLPGGASGGILPASMSDIPLDFDTLQPYGCFIGSAAIIILSDHDNIADVAVNLMEFFEMESCGQCTPCRVGTTKAVALMRQKSWDVPLLKELSTVMMDTSICGLGQAAPNPLLCLFKYFPDEIPNNL